MKTLLSISIVIALIFTLTVQLDGIKSLAQEGDYDKGLSDSLFMFITVAAFLIVDAVCLYVAYQLINDKL